MAGQKPKLRSNARGEVRAGAAGAGRRPAHQGRDGSVRFAQRLRQGACLLRAAGQRQRPAARGAGGARKPRPDPHIEDITRRLALDNFIAFAPDALFPLGAYPGDKDKARDLFGKLDQPKMQQDFVAAAAYLKGVRGGNGKVGAVGFCYSGGVVNMLVTRWPELGAGVPYYGAAPALKAASVKFKAVKYPGTRHGFNNDSTPRCDDKAAKAAGQRTLARFNSTLRG